ncbi:MAG: hypothetical protein ACKVVT_16800 [Dehalococcoidia bacterium]
MWVLRALLLFPVAGLWRVVSLRGLGALLVRALDDQNANVRQVAATFLAKAGRRSIPALRHALEQGEGGATAVLLAGDTGDPQFESMLERLVDSPEPALARAAQDGLRLLRLHARGR